MKKIVVAAFIAAQLSAPAAAADLVDASGFETARKGAFAGARLRVSLDAEPRERVRAGLTLAPTRHGLSSDGQARLRIGEGVEVGLSERRPLELRLAGQPVRALGTGPGGQRQNISTIGWVAIGVVVAAAGGFALFMDAMGDASE